MLFRYSAVFDPNLAGPGSANCKLKQAWLAELSVSTGTCYHLELELIRGRLFVLRLVNVSCCQTML